MSINHLNEKDLIEFQFKLSSDVRTQKIANHLESCNSCRNRLEKLKRKFAALDLLKGEVNVSEELISKLVKQAQKPAKSRIFSLTKSAWLSAAAVLVLGIILFSGINKLNNTGRNNQEPNIVSYLPPTLAERDRGYKSNLTDELNESIGEGNDAERVVAINTEEKGISGLPGVSSLTARSAKGGAGTGALTEKLGQETASALTAVPSAPTNGQSEKIAALETEIGEQPYFAPASAIELVTLPKRENVQLTIYNSADLTLVREKRNLTLKRGWNWLQLMWANTLIDPTSISLEPKEKVDIIDIQALVFPARLRQIGRWLIRSETSGQVPFEITYLTSGLSWRAFYMGTLSEDEKSMDMKGYVRVSNNSGEDYEDAQTRLIVGQVHMLDQIAALAQQQYPYGSPLTQHGIVTDGAWGGRFGLAGDVNVPLLGKIPEVTSYFANEYGRKEIVKEGLSEYFLYTIEGTENIENQWSKRLLSFEANDIKVESLYKYDESRYGNQTIRFVKFKNDEEHNLGKTPIPDGDVKIYAIADKNGYLSYTGGTSVKYIPVNEEVEMNLGAARLVKVEPVLMDFKTDNYMYGSNYDITGWDEIRTWKIKITNTRPIPVTIEITRDFGTNYWTLKSETPYDKYDVTKVRFNLNIEPASKREIEYIVTTYNGTRQDQYNQ
jgi:hypothetical protein